VVAEKKQKKEERLGDLLVKKGLISSSQLDKAVQCQVLFGGRLGTNLLELGFVTEDGLRSVLEDKYGLPSVKRDDLKSVPAEVYGLVPREVAERRLAVPVKVHDDTLKVAMLDPWRESTIQVLVRISSLRIEPLVALELDILWALERYYGIKREARLANLDRWLDQRREKQIEPPVKSSSPMYKSEPLLPEPGEITAQEGAPRTLEEFWDRVGRTGRPEYLLPRVLKGLAEAESRDQIASIILDLAEKVFRRSLLFVVNEDMLFGWDGRGQGIDTTTALSIMLPLSRRSVFKTVIETGAYFLGPFPDTPINRRFLAALGNTRPKSALLLPINVADRVVAILYGDMGHNQSVTGELAPLQSTIHAAGAAFHRLIIRQKAANPKRQDRS